MPRKNPAAEEAEYYRNKLEEMRSRKTYVLEDHVCMECHGGRILRCVTGNGMTPGGNPVYMCSNCGKAQADMGCSFCWCNYTFKNQHESAYMCVPYKEIEECPALLEAFRACGCEPPPPWGRNTRAGAIGVLTHTDYRRARNT